MYNQFTILKRVNTQFQLEDRTSEIALLAPKRNNPPLCKKFKAIAKLRLLFLENELGFF